MPMDRKLYPDNWEEIARAIKTEAEWRCEKCFKPCLSPDRPWPKLVDLMVHTDSIWYQEMFEERFNAQKGEWESIPKPGRFTLTVAHLDHRPENCDRSNLKAMCAPCHCRYDLSQMGKKRYLKRERSGQLNLLD